MKLTSRDGQLKIAPVESDVMRQKAHDLVTLQDVLKLRSAAHAIVDIMPYWMYEELGEIYLKKLKKEVPHKMRQPTINEVTYVDRLIHEHVLNFAAKGQGSLMQGIQWFMDNMHHSYWQFLEPQHGDKPDQGIERVEPKEVTSVPSKASFPKAPPPVFEEPGEKKDKGKCRICGKTRDEHEKRRFCMDPALRREKKKDDKYKGTKRKGTH